MSGAALCVGGESGSDEEETENQNTDPYEEMDFIVRFAWAAAVAHAQSFVDNGKGMIWQFEFRNLFQSKSEGVKQRVLEEELAVGYSFDPRFSLLVPFTRSVGLFDADKAKNYEDAMQLGLGFGYAPLHTDHDRLDISVRFGNTLGGDWHFRSYDAGVRWQSDALWTPLFIGAGVRYVDAYKDGFADYCHVYLSVGVRILWHCGAGRAER